ncbi:MAG: hypothetical protein ACYDEN_06305 [Acidimicrobiales bacterium]
MSAPGRRAGGTSAEMEAICGLRAGLHVVVAGVASVSDFEAWAVPVPLRGDPVTTCDEAVRDQQATPAAMDGR